jgi:hypothetical protein
VVLVVCNASKGKEEKAEERVVRDGRRGEEPRADVDKPSQSSHIKVISYSYVQYFLLSYLFYTPLLLACHTFRDRV